ncbi:MAG: hypothetical protein ACXWG7_00230 [Chthoniobacterales bacterium]
MNTSTNGFFPRVSLAFARKVDTVLIAFVKNIVTLMTGLTSQYPTPTPPLTVITTSVSTFESAVHDALDGGKILIGARNAARAELLSLMRQLAAYVQLNCGANVQNIIATGFEAVRAPSPAGTLPPPGNLRLEYTGMNNGELLLKFDKVANAANYSVQSATSVTGPWEDQDLSTTTRILIGGLTAGTAYWVRAAANGSAGASEWSTAVKATAN